MALPKIIIEQILNYDIDECGGSRLQTLHNAEKRDRLKHVHPTETFSVNEFK